MGPSSKKGPAKDDKPKVYPNAGRVGRTGVVGRGTKPAPAPAPMSAPPPVMPGVAPYKPERAASIPRAVAPRPAPKSVATKPSAPKARPAASAPKKSGGFSPETKAWAAKEQAALRSTKPKAPAAAPKRSGSRGYDDYKKLMS